MVLSQKQKKNSLKYYKASSFNMAIKSNFSCDFLSRFQLFLKLRIKAVILHFVQGKGEAKRTRGHVGTGGASGHAEPRLPAGGVECVQEQL